MLNFMLKLFLRDSLKFSPTHWLIFIIKKRHKICPLFKQWIISEFQFLPGTLKIFLDVLSPFAKWPSFTLFLHRCIQCHSILLILFWTIWISAIWRALPRKAKLSSTSDFPVLMFKIEKAVRFSVKSYSLIHVKMHTRGSLSKIAKLDTCQNAH